MKIKGILFATISLLGISGVFAQEVEHDDMYFNATHREKLKAQQATASTTKEKFKKFEAVEEESVNPTDSYSARNVNPEYTSRQHTEAAQADDEDYYVNNYRYENRNNFDNWNNNYNQWYNSSWYRPNYYGAGINSWNSPYYGYNRYNSPWADPYWSYNGWSTAFSYYHGNSWNYGWGGNYNYYNRPYYGWDSYYGGGYGSGYWNNYRYPGTVVVINNGEAGRKVVYGKRPTRGNAMVSEQSGTRTRSNVYNSGRNDNSGGRAATSNRRQQEYYNRSQNPSNSTFDNSNNSQNNRSRSWDNGNSNSSGRSSTPSYSPSRSSSSDGGSRSSGSGTNGRSRGRD